jgi:hypothetical protein
MSAADVAALLGDARREAGGWRCRCHGGRSLVLRDGEDGRLLATCWAGCNRASKGLRNRTAKEGPRGDGVACHRQHHQDLLC